MGGSNWNDDLYHDRAADRAKTGTPTFAYSADVTAGRVAKKVHDKLSPKGVKREARDSDAHPESLAIGVMCDTTGSMQLVPAAIQKALPKLMGLLLRKGYVAHPQILVGALADYYHERALCLQVGQFESGVEIDDDITRLVLTGGGGGSDEESYNLALYFFAHCTSTDCFEKRGKKGYLFLIGDEMPYDWTSPGELEQILGVTIQKDRVSIEEIMEAVHEKWEVFYVLPRGTTNWGASKITDRWEKLINPQRIIRLEDPEAICETIGLTIGLCEGTVNPASPDVMDKDLKDLGVDAKVASIATGAVSDYAKSLALTRVGTGALPEKKERSTATERL